MNRTWQGFLVGAAVLLASASTWAQVNKPGTREAIDNAVKAAVEEAAAELLASIPAEVRTVSIVPLSNDPDLFATELLRVEVDRLARGRVSIVSRNEAEWNQFLEEFEFGEQNFDVMAPDQVTTFGRFLKVDGFIFGRVRDRGLDESGFRGHCTLTLSLGVTETGQIAATGRGDQRVYIDAGTMLLGFTQQAWFWALVFVGLVAAVVIIVVWIPLRRRLALAAKPREIIR